MAITNEQLTDLYRKMLMVRVMEEMHAKLLQSGQIELMGHFGTGQEAVAIGVTGPLSRDDFLFGTHRGVGEFIGKGMSPLNIWLEYFGKRTSLCKAKSALHLGDRQLNIPPVVSSLGSDFSMAVGTALAAKMRKTDQVTLYYVGEGTCNQADAHPSMNMASLWKLPIVFAVCTNQFCELSYMSEHYPTKDVAPRAAAYNIPSEIVEGQDVEAVYEATKKAVDHARSGKGPYLVEYKTFRMAMHYSGDPGGYVKPDDLEAWAKRDPLEQCVKKLSDRTILSEQDVLKMRDEVQAEVERTVREAMSAPDPIPEDLYEHVYASKEVI